MGKAYDAYINNDGIDSVMTNLRSTCDTIKSELKHAGSSLYNLSNERFIIGQEAQIAELAQKLLDYGAELETSFGEFETALIAVKKNTTEVLNEFKTRWTNLLNTDIGSYDPNAFMENVKKYGPLEPGNGVG